MSVRESGAKTDIRPQKVRDKRHNDDALFDLVVKLLLLAFGIICLYPLWYTIIASISNPAYVNDGSVVLLPKGLTLAAYRALFHEKSIWVGYKNTLFYTTTYTVLHMAVLLPCAFTMSRDNLPGRKLLFFYFLITMYFSGGMAASYILMSRLHLTNTRWIEIIPMGVGVSNLVLMKKYLETNVPESLFESATLDGAGPIRYFLNFVLPLSKPMIAVISLYAVVAKWNAYMGPMIYIRDNSKQVLQVIIKSITANLDTTAMEQMTPEEVDEVMARKQLLKFATVIAAALPLMLLYPFMQRYLISGMTIGAVKE